MRTIQQNSEFLAEQIVGSQHGYVCEKWVKMAVEDAMLSASLLGMKVHRTKVERAIRGALANRNCSIVKDF